VVRTNSRETWERKKAKKDFQSSISGAKRRKTLTQFPEETLRVGTGKNFASIGGC